MSTDQRQTFAVFDVDETLIRCKSMFSFLAFALIERDGAARGRRTYEKIREELQVARRDLARNEVNRLFYSHFAGWDLPQLEAQAGRWFAQARSAADFYYAETCARLRRHREAGHTTILLSGSAHFIIAPIATDLGADEVLAINLKRRPDGTTSGQIDGVQTIGEGKAQALRARLDRGTPAPLVYGYGDHESDLPFLRLCDHAYCVTVEDGAVPEWAAGLEPIRVGGAASAIGDAHRARAPALNETMTRGPGQD